MTAHDRPEWRGDLADDCTATWRGLTLRAEAMGSGRWWWAVYRGREEVDSSWNHGRWPLTGKRARAAADAAARRAT